MPTTLCCTCGTRFAASAAPPAACPICEDERQYVGWQGQRWTTPEALQREHAVRVGDDNGLLALEMEPAFAIGQRALVVSPGRNGVLWECLSLVTDEAVQAIRQRGGVGCIAISHPHFYAAMVAWSEALGGVPVLLHEADRAWVQEPSPLLRFWSGDRLPLSDALTLVRVGGHFPGSTVLHCQDGPRPGGTLLTGDALQVASNRRRVSFMYSYPNLIPLAPAAVELIRARLAGLDFEDVYGYAWGRNIIGGGRASVDASFERYLRATAAGEVLHDFG